MWKKKKEEEDNNVSLLHQANEHRGQQEKMRFLIFVCLSLELRARAGQVGVRPNALGALEGLNSVLTKELDILEGSQTQVRPGLMFVPPRLHCPPVVGVSLLVHCFYTHTLSCFALAHACIIWLVHAPSRMTRLPYVEQRQPT